MLARFNAIVRAIRIGIARRLRRPVQGEMLTAEGAQARLLHAGRAVGVAAVVGLAGWVLFTHPPLRTVGSGEVAAHTNLVTGTVVRHSRGGGNPGLPASGSPLRGEFQCPGSPPARG